MTVRGLYRTRDRLLGDCIHVHWSGGDAAPLVPVRIYAALGGRPPIEDLPDRTSSKTEGEYSEADAFE